MKNRVNRYDRGCCDHERDARAMGYSSAYAADQDNWGDRDEDPIIIPIDIPKSPAILPTEGKKSDLENRS